MIERAIVKRLMQISGTRGTVSVVRSRSSSEISFDYASFM
jgi:hypothetical protein